MCLRPAVFSWVASLSDAHVSICFSCEANRCFLDKCYPLPQWTFRLFVFAISVLVCVSICGRGPALASHSHLCSLSVACWITNSEGCSRSHQHNLVQRRPKGCILRSPRFGSSMSVFCGALHGCFIFCFPSGFFSFREAYDFRLRFAFDHTLGFPGEGPVNSDDQYRVPQDVYSLENLRSQCHLFTRNAHWHLRVTPRFQDC